MRVRSGALTVVLAGSAVAGVVGFKDEFGLFALAQYAAHLESGDVDGDGVSDLIKAGSFSNHVAVLRNDGTGQFGPECLYATGGRPETVLVVDVDGDGRLDLVAPERDGCNAGGPGTGCAVSIFYNLGTQTGGCVDFDRETFTTGYFPERVAAGDLNGDGLLDFVTTGTTGPFYIVFNLGAGAATRFHFAAPVETGNVGFPSGLATGDFDGNGTVDIAWASSHMPKQASVLFNRTPQGGAPGQGSLAWSELELPLITNAPVHGVAVGDFDGDGMEDLVTSAFAPTGNVIVFLNSGVPEQAMVPVRSTLTEYAIWPTAVDVDLDGRADVAFVDTSVQPPRFTVHYNLRGTGLFTALEGSAYELGSAWVPSALALADYDQDGDVDAAVSHLQAQGSEYAVLFNQHLGSPRQPSSARAVRGRVVHGARTSLYVVDGGALRLSSEQGHVAALLLRFDGGVVAAPDLEISVDARARSGAVAARVHLFDWDRGAWELVRIETLVATDPPPAGQPATVIPGASRFIGLGGDLRALLVYEAAEPFEVDVDRANVRNAQ